MSSESPVFRKNGISYIEIPTRDVKRSAAFYHNVFEWQLGGNPENPSFADGTGHVIGHWKSDLEVAGDAGVLPYIFVENVNRVLERVKASGGNVVTEPYREGDLWVAKFRDPEGNVLGLWSRAEKT
jgi:uncharacterized protein